MSAVVAGLLLTGAFETAAPPQASVPQETPVYLEDLEIQGRRGSAGIPAEIEIDRAAIHALDLWSVGEVAARLAETYGGQEPPIMIINGRRVADPGLYYNLPPDALSRVEVLPPGAATTFGGPVSGRVINLVLARQFASVDGEARSYAPTAGGLTGLAFTARANRLVEQDITGLSLNAFRSTALYGDERANFEKLHPDLGALTLQPASNVLSAQLASSRTLGDWSASLNANASQRQGRWVSVTGGVPIASERYERTASVVLGVSGRPLDWAVSIASRALMSEVRREGRTTAEGSNRVLGLEVGADRRFTFLPAGPMSLSLSAGLSDSRTETRGDLAFHQAGQARLWSANALIPVFGRQIDGQGSWGADLALSTGRHESDAGGGASFQVGLNARLWRKFRLNAAWSQITEVPTDADRFAIASDGPSMLVYDFRNRESVQVETIEGGNPLLRATSTEGASFSLAIGPFTSWDVSGSMNANVREGSDSVIRDLAVNVDNEARFPERFQRGDSGRLIRIDRRPLNLGAFSTTSLEFTLVSSLDGGRLFPAPVQMQLKYSRLLEDRVAQQPGLRSLDRLSGDNGGVAPSGAQMEISTASGRWFLNLSARWEAAYRRRRTNWIDGPDDLIFEPWATANVRVGFTFARPSFEGGRRPNGATGTRIELTVENIADSTRRARFADGRTVSGWGGDDSGSVGRVVRVRLARRF